MKAYVDSQPAYYATGSTLSTPLNLATGKHRLVVAAWDNAGTAYTSAPQYFTVGATVQGVTLQTPANGASVSSPVHVQGSASAANPITAMRVYVDNVSVYQVSAANVNIYYSFSPGTHYLVLQAWDSTGAVYKTSATITVQ
jgi:hypothetical protein